MKKTILSSAPHEEEGVGAKNEDSYGELIQILDETSQLLVMRDAAGDGKKAFKMRQILPINPPDLLYSLVQKY